MKDFLKYTLATIVGIIACSIILSVIGILSFVGIAASAGTAATTTISNSSLFKLELKGTVNERVVENPFATLMGEEQAALGLNDILASIQKAADNDLIKGIYLEAGNISAQPASIEEIRNALVRFKQTGKFIVAYGDTYSEADYYICSVADKVILNPKGIVDWHGLASQTIYFKDLLDQLGVEMEVFKVGTYKSAVEPYTSTEMSDENREQITAYITSIWNNMVDNVSLSRGISAEQLNYYADQYMAFCPTEECLTAGLVDTLLYKDATRDYLKQLMNTDEDDRLEVVTLNEVKNIQKNVPLDKSGNIIAVYYAYGEIDSTPSTDEGINSKKVIRDLRKLREDEAVKAVVLRVNSPGGSAFGSEQIWREVLLLKAEKPVIVSMGDYAASGGYYISCAADCIVADPTTLTGSIGIFGMFPMLENLLTDKLDLHFATVKTNRYADMGDMTRPFNDAERAALQKYINNGYKLFVQRCADGRGMSVEAIEKIAEGRVWTGATAKELGLVDELGGLDKAIEIAAQKSGIEAYSIIHHPSQESFFDSLMEPIKEDYIQGQLAETMGEYYEYVKFIQNVQNMDRIQARMPFDLRIR